MRSESNRLDPRAADANEGLQASMNNWFNVGRTAESCARAGTRTNLELMTLMSQRTQAYLSVPNRLAACRTPHDLANEQVRFWQTAFQQYAEAARHITAAWTSLTPVSQMMAFWPQMAPAADGRAGQGPNGRDFITFPEPAAAPSQETKGRRAA